MVMIEQVLATMYGARRDGLNVGLRLFRPNASKWRGAGKQERVKRADCIWYESGSVRVHA